MKKYETIMNEYEHIENVWQNMNNYEHLACVTDFLIDLKRI